MQLKSLTLQKRKLFISLFLGITLLLLALFYMLKPKAAQDTAYALPEEDAFSAYISAYTLGVISSESPIQVRFTADVAPEDQVGLENTDNVFSIDPAVTGKAYWVDSRTLSFQPHSPLNSGSLYKINLKLHKLMEVPKVAEVFSFSVKTMEQNFEVSIEGMRPYDKKDLKKQKFLGMVLTADVIKPEDIQGVLTASQSGKKLLTSWQHSEDRRTHYFVVEDVARMEKSSEVELSWDGKPLGIQKAGSSKLEVPALDDFKLMEGKVVQGEEQYISLQFSDPLLEAQTLEGLVKLEGNPGLRYLINENELKVYPAVRQTGSLKVEVSAGIKNILNYKMKNGHELSLLFEQMNPAVRLVKSGTILPSTDGLVLPFEAVSLKAVDVQIVKIFEDNVGQFLQVNGLDGKQELKRVGRPLIQKTVPLNASGITDFGRWNRFQLDLSEFIEAEPGAIYQVTLGFRKQHSAYFCSEGGNTETELTEFSATDGTNWDEADQHYYNDYYYEDYYYDEDYDYSQRDNPCNGSYYGRRRNVSTNILASDLSIIAKRGDDGKLLVVVTDMKTTQPLAGVSVKVLNYQQREISSGTSNSDGMAELLLDKKPFLLVASYGGQRGYLKLDDGTALSLSNFDVAGEKIERGIKGFIYAERDVWRPGDSLYVNFVLQDLDKTLPKNYPVVMELSNPQGQLIRKMVKANPVGGFYAFHTATSPDAPTGNWTARVKAGGATFSKTIKIETIKPNRLKIRMSLPDGTLRAGHSNLVILSVNWLHGATAKHLKADVEMIVVPAVTEFKKYPNYIFDDPAKKFESESQLVFEDRVDDNGLARFNIKTGNFSQAPGMLKAVLKTKVFEEGGDFSVDRLSFPLQPYESYVGIQDNKKQGYEMLETARLQQVELVTVDTAGRALGRQDVEVELIKLDWSWWWDQNENNANYMSRTHQKVYSKGKVSTIAGKGSWQFKVDHNDWGRYLIRAKDPVSGHTTGKIVYIDWPNTYDRSGRQNPGGAAMLSLSADKEKYGIKEEMKLSFPSPAAGRALVSIENGSRIIRTFWADVQKGETTVNIPISAEMTPNAYVHISLLQPHSQTTNDLPVRLYGVLPVLVEDPATHLQPEIQMPEKLQPETPFSITVKEKAGRKMTYTLAVVDEGLLDITRFKTPEPWKAFYKREALGVKTWDMYQYVIGAYGGRLERLLAIGGDEAGRKVEGSKVNRFKPVVKFLGPYVLEDGASNTHNLSLQPYVGSVRVMVVAGEEGAYGQAEKTVPVKQPLMLLGTLPRVLGPGESVSLPVSVFAMEDGIRNVNVDIKQNELLSLAGESSQQLSFSKPDDQTVYFDLKVQPRVGAGKVKIEAYSGSHKASYDIDIPVRNPNPPATEVYQTIVPAGQSWNQSFAALGMAGTNKTYLEVSNMPSFNVAKRLQYLVQYPYGCIEQTTSSAFPQLYVQSTTELDAHNKQSIERNIKAAIDRLRGFQHSSGGFGYWPGVHDADDWGTSYAGHFLVEAANRGYAVPDDMLKRWKKYQKQKAENWQRNSRYNDDLNQAYRLYTLALAKAPETGAMNRFREQRNLSTAAQWRLAAAYALAGQKEAGMGIVAKLGKEVTTYSDPGDSYGSALRDQAMILETMLLLDQEKESMDLVMKISQALSEDSWMSTQTTAYCLIAGGKLYERNKDTGNLDFSYSLNGKSEKAATALPLVRKEVNISEKVNNQLAISNSGKGKLYVRVFNTGTPVNGDETNAENHLNLNVVYRDMQGNVIDPTGLEQGTDFMAEVSVSNPGTRGNYKNLALSQIFPSGWEIHNARMDSPGTVEKTGFDYQDIRDDRVYTFFSLNAREKKTFRVLLNASYSGKFYLPAVSCEAMYDNSISARKAGSWVTVGRNGLAEK
ncbi:alpha-2-macroglobulin [Flammeovirgaceae bacterium 311]|nr:alpha-2-macroglobulin [Flammeovirgaceae bacterium 311]